MFTVVYSVNARHHCGCIYRQHFVEVFAKNSYDKADKLADYLERWVPAQLVSDPSFEVDGSKEIKRIVQSIREQHGEEGVTKMTSLLAEFMLDHNANTRSYVRAILAHKS